MSTSKFGKKSRETGLNYLDVADVEDVRRSKAPLNYSRSGYGGKIGTQWEIRLGGIWRRVYVMQYSNAGTAYVMVQGSKLFLGSFEPSWWLEERGRS